LSNIFAGVRVILPAGVISASMLSPSRRPATRRHSAGSRTARLLPHLANCSLISPSHERKIGTDHGFLFSLEQLKMVEAKTVVCPYFHSNSYRSPSRYVDIHV